MVLGLAGVESHTGEVTAPNDTAEAAKRYERGDILYSRLRPYLNKAARMEDGGLCSTEFYVLRARPGYDPDYIAVALRSPAVLAQTCHMATGNTHPRVAESDARGVLLPIPRSPIQGRVVGTFDRRRRSAHELRSEAESTWTAALATFDKALLG